MKKMYLPLWLFFLLPLTFSCSVGNLAGYRLTERDAADAIRQMLQLGTREGNFRGAFSKDMILSTVFPEPVKKVLNTVQALGITNEVDRFTTTLSTAAEKTAEASIPVFVGGINRMPLTDALRLVKGGGTAATDYLRSSVGDSLRRSIKPIMQATLDEYKLNEQWNNIVKPLGGNRLNLDLSNIMAGVVTEAMFRKIAEKERQVRADAAARSTPLLQRVFSRNWNDSFKQ